MKLLCHELYIAGAYSVLYGIDWEANNAIYRQVVGGEAIYVRVPIPV